MKINKVTPWYRDDLFCGLEVGQDRAPIHELEHLLAGMGVLFYDAPFFSGALECILRAQQALNHSYEVVPTNRVHKVTHKDYLKYNHQKF